MIEILEYNFINVGGYQLNLLTLLEISLIIIGARLLLWFANKVLQKAFRIKKVDLGRQLAVKQFIKYIVYTLVVLACLQIVGVNLTLLWAGSTALMVGIGLGMQQFFMNLVSGLILLIEGSVDVNDIVVVDNLIARVVKIGIRTSEVETRDDMVIIVPNSKLVAENVINWSHNNAPSRFQINLGIAYASDTELVKSLVENLAYKHPQVLPKPAPELQFSGFGDSALEFTLYFYSDEFRRIERVKSELRYQINTTFRENKIEIPFPQRDLWFRNTLTNSELPLNS